MKKLFVCLGLLVMTSASQAEIRSDQPYKAKAVFTCFAAGFPGGVFLEEDLISGVITAQVSDSYHSAHARCVPNRLNKQEWECGGAWNITGQPVQMVIRSRYTHKTVRLGRVYEDVGGNSNVELICREGLR